jgi:hypothetical protein
MVFTTLIFIEVSLFVIWFAYKIVSVMRKHKVITSIIIIGAIYILISGHPSNVVNTNSQKSNVPKNAADGYDITTASSSDNSLSTDLHSVLQPGEDCYEIYPGENCYETGADGHRIILRNSKNAVNPTYQQLMDFIAADDSDKIPYNNSNFKCADFAECVHNNAESAGYKCAWVDIRFINNGDAHACNAFNTVDQGMVFIDCADSGNPSNDKIVDLKVGKGYLPEDIGDRRHIYHSRGIVRKYTLYW